MPENRWHIEPWTNTEHIEPWTNTKHVSFVLFSPLPGFCCLIMMAIILFEKNPKQKILFSKCWRNSRPNVILTEFSDYFSKQNSKPENIKLKWSKETLIRRIDENDWRELLGSGQRWRYFWRTLIRRLNVVKSKRITKFDSDPNNFHYIILNEWFPMNGLAKCSSFKFQWLPHLSQSKSNIKPRFSRLKSSRLIMASSFWAAAIF